MKKWYFMDNAGRIIVELTSDDEEDTLIRAKHGKFHLSIDNNEGARKNG